MDDPEPDGLTGTLTIKIEFGNAAMQYWEEARRAIDHMILDDCLLDAERAIVDYNGNTVGLARYES